MFRYMKSTCTCLCQLLDLQACGCILLGDAAALHCCIAQLPHAAWLASLWTASLFVKPQQRNATDGKPHVLPKLHVSSTRCHVINLSQSSHFCPLSRPENSVSLSSSRRVPAPSVSDSQVAQVTYLQLLFTSCVTATAKQLGLL